MNKYTLLGTPCPEITEGHLVAVSCHGSLVKVPRSFPGSFDPGKLFDNQQESLAFRRELSARACERLAKQALDPTAYTTWESITPEMGIEAARLCRAGDLECDVVLHVLRFAGPIQRETKLYGM